MKKIALVVLAFTVSNASIATGVAGAEHGRHTKTIASKFEAFNRHDVAAIKASYALDAVLHSPDYPDLHGNSTIANTYQRLFDAVPDARDTVQALGYFENKVYVQFLLSGHVSGAPDKPVSVRIVSVYTIRDDLIVDDSTYYDRKAP